MPKQNKYGSEVFERKCQLEESRKVGLHWKINNGIEGPVLVELQRLLLETDRRSRVHDASLRQTIWNTQNDDMNEFTPQQI